MEEDLKEPRTKEKLFRLSPGEERNVNNLIAYAYKTGYISKSSFQDLMLFAIRCAFTYLKQDFDQRKGVGHEGETHDRSEPSDMRNP